MLRIDLKDINFPRASAGIQDGQVVTARVFQRLNPQKAYINILGLKLLAESDVPIPDSARYTVHQEGSERILLKLLKGGSTAQMASAENAPTAGLTSGILGSFLLKKTPRNLEYVQYLLENLGPAVHGSAIPLLLKRSFPLLSLLMTADYYPEKKEIERLLKGGRLDLKILKKYPGIFKNLNNLFLKNTENSIEFDLFQLVMDDGFLSDILEHKNMEVDDYARNYLTGIRSRRIFQYDFTFYDRQASLVWFRYDKLDLSVYKLAVTTVNSGEIRALIIKKMKNIRIDFDFENEYIVNKYYGLEGSVRSLVRGRLGVEPEMTMRSIAPVDNLLGHGNEKIFDYVFDMKV